MGAAPAISAGVSLISGVAGISSKNAAAKAQREQITAESRANAQKVMSQEASLAAAASSAQVQYSVSMLSRLQQFQQADAGLKAQEASKELQAQQEAYAVQSNQLQGASQLAQQSNALARENVQIQNNADAQRQASDIKAGGVASQAEQQLQQLEAQLTEGDRRKLSLEASSRQQSTSNQTAKEGEMMRRISTALSAGLDLDRVTLEAELQRMNQEDLIDISERLGLSDNANSVESVAASLRHLNLSTDANLQNIDADTANTRSAVRTARASNAATSAIDMRGAADAYSNQQFSIGTQRSLNRETGQQLTQQSDAQLRATKGASLLDWVNTGVNTYGAVSPLLGGKRVAASTPTSGSNGLLDYMRQVRGYQPSTTPPVDIYVPPPENDMRQYVGQNTLDSRWYQ